MSRAKLTIKSLSTAAACAGFVSLLFLALASAQSCDYLRPQTLVADSLFLVTENSDLVYDLKKPDDKIFLPYVLTEISGLSFSGEASILMVEDETGKVYDFSLRKKKIVGSWEFKSSGDFEGIERVGEDIFVVKSNGDIYKFPAGAYGKVEASDNNTLLSGKNDVEGLGYDPEKNLLLLALKGDEDIEENKAKGKAVYGFSIQQNQLLEKELLEITYDDLDDFYEKSKGWKYDKDKLKFKPSGIAFHPIEKRYYIIASVGKLLLVVEPNGEIVASYPIFPRVLSQPEGICFAPNGDMFISSEGEGDRGYIVVFRPRSNRQTRQD